MTRNDNVSPTLAYSKSNNQNNTSIDIALQKKRKKDAGPMALQR